MRSLLAGFAAALLLSLLGSGCSSGSSGSSNVTWKCCATGSTCRCYQEGPNSAVLCSDEVASCHDIDGGVGCCMASSDQCECGAPGEACPTMTDPAAQVAHCPP